MPSAAADLRLTRLSKSYPTAGGTLSILRDIDLSLSRGECLVITGPSGAGKSTLLYVVGTLETPTAGSVEILGQDPFTLDGPALARFRNANIGFVFQDHCLLPQCTVLENVLIPTLAGSGAGLPEETRARQLLERVGLAERVGHRPAELSGGERQRVAICRALINQPPLLLADEPTGNLDRHTAQTIGTLLLELAQEQNALLIVVTHSTELAARFTRKVELVDGRLEEQSSSMENRGPHAHRSE
ncbi:MAG TPA: ABC transporter ATP-binding protein [Planctomycetaceae bacterium]|nr:ABC transporter ATP-binding protein [Planctomycetaceae bacterium]